MFDFLTWQDLVKWFINGIAYLFDNHIWALPLVGLLLSLLARTVKRAIKL